MCCALQTAIVPHVSLDIHNADFGRLLDPKAVEQKVQYSMCNQHKFTILDG